MNKEIRILSVEDVPADAVMINHELRRAGLLFRERVRVESDETAARVTTLTHLLPICAHCKKIRDGDDDWQAFENYFRKHLGVDFTHGLCPECEPIFLPGQLARK